MTEWTDEELAAAVAAYRDMQRCEAERKPYSKKNFYRELAARFRRTDKAFEFRMQNISAVLQELEQPWVPGLKPAANVGTNVKDRIVALLQRPSRLPNVKDQAAYKAKLPAMRDWLIRVARARKKVIYSDVMHVFDIDRFSLRHAMDYLGHEADNRDEPIITALIVSKGSGHCSKGLEAEFGVVDDEAERQRLYSYWEKREADPSAQESEGDLAVKAARFASVEVRPDQAAFRGRVFKSCQGRCVISGCDIGKALDAAHRIGRHWKSGDNAATDGFLLRKDLHALYDGGLLKITDAGVVDCNLDHYRQFHGLSLALD
jgi:hypothetical protein